MLTEIRDKSDTPYLNLADFARQEYAQAKKQKGINGRLYKNEIKSFFGFFMRSEYTCLCCDSHEISVGSLELFPPRFEENYAVGGLEKVEEGSYLRFYQCRDCKNILFCEEN